LSTLNSQQRAAIHYIDGPLLVLAGAGSGKTLVITRKIAWLIEHCGLSPKRIYAVTFTNKAAREMKTRVTKLLNRKRADEPNISTFHSLGLNIIRTELDSLGYSRGFSIFDTEDSATLLRELMHKEFSSEKAVAERVQWQISQWKNACLSPEQVLADASIGADELAAARVYSEYNRHLKAYNAVDFDDLILLPVRLFQQRPDTLAAWQERIRYLLIDEYQDTNACQYELVRLLVHPRGALTAVGDDDQSVYAWRGARPQNLTQLQQEFVNLKLIMLEQNYRSTGRILKAANALIANNGHIFEKRLWSKLGYGDPIRVIQTRNDEHEVERVISDLRHHMFLNKNGYGDYALLYRSNHQSRLFERVLREHRIPYFLSGGISFFERTEIKCIMAYLRLICNQDDDNAFLRVVNTPRREIGPATLEQLGHYATRRGTSLSRASTEMGLEQFLSDRQSSRLKVFTQWLAELSRKAEHEQPVEVVKTLLAELHFDEWLLDSYPDRKAAERRMENVQELVSWIERMAKRGKDDTTLYDIVANISLLGILDKDEDQNGGQVCLMTLHAAKGLEFPHVYIVGMEENVLPHHASLSEAGLEEERRLAYVGITRAQKSLSFSFAAMRKRGGEIIECEPSRFLEELPRDDLQWDGVDTGTRQEQRERGEKCLAGLREILDS